MSLYSQRLVIANKNYLITFKSTALIPTYTRNLKNKLVGVRFLN